MNAIASYSCMMSFRLFDVMKEGQSVDCFRKRLIKMGEPNKDMECEMECSVLQ